MSLNWTSTASLDSESRSRLAVLESIKPSEVSQLGLEIRASLSHDIPRTPLKASLELNKVAAGRFNVVVKLVFSDGLRWIVRIRLPQDSASEQSIRSSMESEIATINLIRAETSIPAPRVYLFDPSTNNAVGAAFMLMEELPGRILDGRFAFNVPQDQQARVARQFASMYYQLSTLRAKHIVPADKCTASFPRSGHGMEQLQHQPSEWMKSRHYLSNHESNRFAETMPLSISTSIEYFYLKREALGKATLEQSGADCASQTAVWFLQQAVSSMVIPEALYGPWPLCHLDMHYNNVLLDEDYNITGIVDWSDLSTGPVELFAANTEFQTYPGLSQEDNAPIKRFRNLVSEEVKRLAKASEDSLGHVLSDLIGSSTAELVYRCICTHPWRAQVDARMALKILYGEESSWETFEALHRKSDFYKKSK